MGFSIEQECPQCGAPIELDETDRLIKCPYCEVKNFIFSNGYLRFVLPDRAPGRDLIYAPYLRFRGSIYYCGGQDVGYRIVDITRLGVAIKGVPVSLGVRPQALKMRFVTADTGGSFLRFAINPGKIIEDAGKLSSMANSGRLIHRAFIGETVSVIYLPTYIDGQRLFDGIVNKSIATIPDGGESIGISITKDPRWKVQFIPTLCPNCGWNLEGQHDSVVLSCHNCKKAWSVSNGNFVKVSCFFTPSSETDAVYLPFWKITASSEGLRIDSFADFLRLTNQPKVIRDEWNNADMCFWSPAFKIRPKVFLALSRQFTVSQYPGTVKEGLPGKMVYPVTLPLTESIQSIKTILAYSAVKKKDIIPNLPSTTLSVKESSLVYLPFIETGSEMVQEDTGSSINKNTLEFGRHL